MHVIATFEQSIFLELAISSLEQKGVPKEHILAVPLGKRTESRQIMDTIHRADGFSMLDLASVLGTVLMLLGAIYGHVLPGGPILWGIIGSCFGLIVGFVIKYAMVKKKSSAHHGSPHKLTSEVVLIIQCEESESEMVQKALWDNNALGVSKIKGSTARA